MWGWWVWGIHLTGCGWGVTVQQVEFNVSLQLFRKGLTSRLGAFSQDSLC